VPVDLFSEKAAKTLSENLILIHANLALACLKSGNGKRVFISNIVPAAEMLRKYGQISHFGVV